MPTVRGRVSAHSSTSRRATPASRPGPHRPDAPPAAYPVCRCGCAQTRRAGGCGSGYARVYLPAGTTTLAVGTYRVRPEERGPGRRRDAARQRNERGAAHRRWRRVLRAARPDRASRAADNSRPLPRPAPPPARQSPRPRRPSTKCAGPGRCSPLSAPFPYFPHQSSSCGCIPRSAIAAPHRTLAAVAARRLRHARLGSTDRQLPSAVDAPRCTPRRCGERACLPASPPRALADSATAVKGGYRPAANERTSDHCATRTVWV